MRIIALGAVAAGLCALAACNQTPAENKADAIEANAENTADVIEDTAGNQAEAVREEGENKADAVENSNTAGM